MSDSSKIENSQPASPAPKRRNGMVRRLVLYACLGAVLVYAGTYVGDMIRANGDLQQTQDRAVASAGLITPTPKLLAAAFTDREGRMLADPPSDASKLLDPDTLVVAHIIGSEENPGTSWDVFETHLAQATGKKVSDLAYDNSSDQLAQIGDGKIHIVAVHAADTPFLVDNYGFQPVAVLGTSSGANGNHLDIIVPADSPINAPTDLKGHTLVCTTPTSITGYRAAIALLMRDQALRPNVDYYLSWSMGQKRSINGVAAEQYDAAAASDDKVQSMEEAGDVDKSKIRVIYQSDVIPRTTIGYFYNLKPDLAAKVTQAILSFNPSAVGPSTAPAAGDVVHFLAINYKSDFTLVRAIDDSFDPRLDFHKPPKTAQ